MQVNLFDPARSMTQFLGRPVQPAQPVMFRSAAVAQALPQETGDTFVLSRPRVAPAPTPEVHFGTRRSIFSLGDDLLGAHDPADTELNKWNDMRLKIWDVATRQRPGLPQGYLQPQDTIFQVVDFVKLMQAAARDGFETRFNHWSHGQEFNELYQPQRYGLSKIYELVINTQPAIAYLLNDNPDYAQNLVMAHVYGHTDFFANNVWFSQANKKIDHVMGETKRAVQKYKMDPLLLRRAEKTPDGYHPVDRFIDDYLSIQYFVDTSLLSPPPITPLDQRREQPEIDLPEDVGPDAEGLGLGRLMKDFLMPKDRQDELEEAAIAEQERRAKQIPPHPTRDLLGFLVEHSQALEPWQRDLLGRFREESYYFAPQIRTKVMNEGWASFWHNKLTLENPELIDLEHMTEVSRMASGVERPNRRDINPYWLGVNLFREIFERAGRDIPPEADSERLREMYSREEWQAVQEQEVDETKGVQAIQHVRTYEDDLSFIEKYLTDEVMAKLNIYYYDTFTNYDGSQADVLVTKDPDKVKDRLRQRYQNGGIPVVEVVNGNYGGNGQLLLRHGFLGSGMDLNRKESWKWLEVVQRLWGQPVHLDTQYTVEADLQPLNQILQQLHRYRQYEEQGYPAPEGAIEELTEQYFEVKEGARTVPIRLTVEPGKPATIYELDPETGDFKLDQRGNRIKWDPKKYVDPRNNRRDMYW